MPRITDKPFVFVMNDTNATCPISLQVFLQPALTIPCGHYFEKDIIQQWHQNNKDCPCCQKPIECIHPAPKEINDKLDEILKKNPEMYEDCYFSIKLFLRTLRNNDEVLLEKMLNILRHSKKQMNAVSDAKEYAGVTPAICLLSEKKGHEVLRKHAELYFIIDEQALMIFQKPPVKSFGFFSCLKRIILCQDVSDENDNAFPQRWKSISKK